MFMMGEIIVEVLYEFSFLIDCGEFLVIVGLSGFGKMILFNLFGGFDVLISGEIWFEE